MQTTFRLGRSPCVHLGFIFVEVSGFFGCWNVFGFSGLEFGGGFEGFFDGSDEGEAIVFLGGIRDLLFQGAEAFVHRLHLLGERRIVLGSEGGSEAEGEGE